MNMKIKSLFLSLAIVLMVTPSLSAVTKDKKKDSPKRGYIFTTVKENPITSVKNQYRSGTCWCFSALSFLESEAIKAGYSKDIELSRMFVVKHSYNERAKKYVRLHGHLNFSAGSSFGDVLEVIKKDGIVPYSIMTGMNYGDSLPNQTELDNVLKGYVENVIKSKYLTTAWERGLQGILDAYLGEYPSNFEYKGKEYNPITYRNSLGINMDDYVDLTSWTHHPFYEKMVIEVADNWRWEQAYNIPIDDLMRIMDNAINNGYTIAWASDVSETGFSRNGIATVPDKDAIKAIGSDQEHWTGKNGHKMTTNPTGPKPEKVITQEMRQEAFDNYHTTDDHGMHMFGIAKDQNGTKYYMVKNSWGDAGKYKGIWYFSAPFVKYKTMDMVVNKNAIPQDIREKLGI